mgnify:CR=1 FL=1
MSKAKFNAKKFERPGLTEDEIEEISETELTTTPEEMEEKFRTISDGGYANILFAQFGKDRVENELNEFLKKDFFPRSGGGIGVTRMIRAMKLSNLI